MLNARKLPIFKSARRRKRRLQILGGLAATLALLIAATVTDREGTPKPSCDGQRVMTVLIPALASTGLDHMEGKILLSIEAHAAQAAPSVLDNVEHTERCLLRVRSSAGTSIVSFHVTQATPHAPVRVTVLQGS